jgi:membrane protease YdiL (CAAX protease family)
MNSKIADGLVTAGPPTQRSPLAFFVVALGLAIPIWGLSRFAGVIGALKIPVTDLLLGFTPLGAASILVWRADGAAGLVRFLGRALDYRQLVRTPWFAVVLLLAPCIYVLTYFGLHLAGHAGEPSSDLLRLPLLAAIMFLLAIGEEAGWTGYLLDPLQARFGALGASLVIALPWWLGHIPSILEIGGSATDLAWWVPGAIALRILMTWLYNNTRCSVLAVVLFHTLLNVGRSAVYPTVGSHYDPVYQATGYLIALSIALIVLWLWGAKRLRGAEMAGTAAV